MMKSWKIVKWYLMKDHCILLCGISGDGRGGRRGTFTHPSCAGTGGATRIVCRNQLLASSSFPWRFDLPSGPVGVVFRLLPQRDIGASEQGLGLAARSFSPDRFLWNRGDGKE